MIVIISSGRNSSTDFNNFSSVTYIHYNLYLIRWVYWSYDFSIPPPSNRIIDDLSFGLISFEKGRSQTKIPSEMALYEHKSRESFFCERLIWRGLFLVKNEAHEHTLYLSLKSVDWKRAMSGLNFSSNCESLFQVFWEELATQNQYV